MRNIAALGCAFQSSLSKYSLGQDEAENALLGFAPEGYAFHTSKEENPWWCVDLRRIYPLYSLHIHPRIGYEYTAVDIKVSLSCDGCHWRETEAPLAAQEDYGPYVVYLNYWQARFIRIQLKKTASLYLRQVEVMYDDKVIPFRGVNLIRSDIISNRVFQKIINGKYEYQEIDTALQTVSDDDIVLELGASLGAMSTVINVYKHPKHYLAVEANKDLINIMKKNHELNNVNQCEIIHGVVAIQPEDWTNFYINKHSWSSSLIPFPNPLRIDKVKMYDINTILNESKSTYIICDIEGGEYSLFNKEICLDHVRKICIEFHIKNINDTLNICSLFKERGFKTDSPLPSVGGLHVLYFLNKNLQLRFGYFYAYIANFRRKFGIYNNKTLYFFKKSHDLTNNNISLYRLLRFKRATGVKIEQGEMDLFRFDASLPIFIKKFIIGLCVEKNFSIPYQLKDHAMLTEYQHVFRLEQAVRESFVKEIQQNAKYGICVVGNCILNKITNINDFIDSHGLVIRFNHFITGRLTGYKCNIVGINPYYYPQHNYNLWYLISGPDNWLLMCDKYHDKKEKTVTIPLHIWNRLVYILQRPPTVGLLTLAFLHDILGEWNNISAVGFSLNKYGKHISYKNKISHRHWFAGEMELLRSWQMEGLCIIDQ